jgi:hypothetical protein
VTAARAAVFEGFSGRFPPYNNGRGGVSHNKLKTPSKDLQEAEFLDLLRWPAEAGAPVVAEIAAAIASGECRLRKRGEKEHAKLATAVAAVVGGVLVAALTRGVPVFRPMDPHSFDGPVGYRTAAPVLDGLARLGLLTRYSGIRFRRAVDGAGDVPGGRATRFLATDALLGIANRHGITAASVKAAFPRVFPATAARIAQPITIAAIDERAGGARVRGGALRLPVPATAESKALASEVRLANAILARAVWAGCQPPALYRAFRRDFTLGGRWIVAGAVPIQGLPLAERLRIRIDGAAVAEIDASASQLALLAAAAGIPRLPEKPYHLPGFDRAVVKQAVVAALGLGRLPARWPDRMLAAKPDLADVELAALISELATAYPFLAAPGKALGVDKARVSLRLQNIEAAALTRAMLPLWRDGVPAVPIHDGLLCPATTAERVARLLVESYAAAGAHIEVKTEHPPGRR